MPKPMPPEDIVQALRAGQVIPAHPLALTSGRTLDERRQRALTRYYCAAGAGGVAVGVHTTQFAIREPKHGLFKPVIELASETVDTTQGRAVGEGAANREIGVPRLGRPIIKIGGICGRTEQAVREAAVLAGAGYHAGLLSLAALHDDSVDQLIAHCAAVAEVIPLMGFYLQPAVGGRLLPVSFWRRFAAIENVVGIKIAPFNRYQTLDVVRGIAESGRGGDIALYTGNDDNIIVDLLTTYRLCVGKTRVSLRMAGGLLGHWAVWTRQAVHLLEECRRMVNQAEDIPPNLLTRALEVTDANAAFFDVQNNFAGCIPGIHEVLRRQGLLANGYTLDPAETLSPGQEEEIDRVYAAYPHLNDDAFVEEHLDEWLK